MPDAGDNVLESVAQMASELGSVARLSILRCLLEDGPSRVRSMADQLGMPEPTLSNHLRRLRESGLVSVTRSGNTAVYEIANPHLGDVFLSLTSAVGDPGGGFLADHESDLRHARSCYDHLAGEIGVRLTRGMLQQGAIEFVEGEVIPSRNAEPVFAALGVGLTALPENRRKSYLCKDWTHGEVHLAGALGAAVLHGLISKGWVQRVTGSRRLIITPIGETGLAPFLAEPD